MIKIICFCHNVNCFFGQRISGTDRFMVHGLWFMVTGSWFMVYGSHGVDVSTVILSPKSPKGARHFKCEAEKTHKTQTAVNQYIAKDVISSFQPPPKKAVATMRQ